MYIPLILGTAREGRETERVAHAVLDYITEHKPFETELLDVRDYVTAPQTSGAMSAEKAADWQEKATRADGFIIISPEYNHGYPGELKLMLDQLYAEYAQKPVGICAVSMGAFGGTRLTQALRPVLVEFQLVPLRNAFYVADVTRIFDESGKMGNIKYLQPMLDELVWYANTLAAGRANAPLKLRR